MFVVIGVTYLAAMLWFTHQTGTNYFKDLIGFGFYMLMDTAKILIAYRIYKHLPQNFLDDMQQKNDRQFKQNII